jgi:heterodisulfide reductase subunit D
MDSKKIIDEINSCIDCLSCLDICDTYLVTGNLLQSPNGRLKLAKKIFTDEKVTDEEIKAIYTCTLCSMCDKLCQMEIPISEIILNSKIRLVQKGFGPLEIHKKITDGIIKNANSVNGNPEERLNWVPQNYLITEMFENKNSDTLLFLGCMSSFRVKESASASYELLKKANYDFKILQEEPCCGEYVYSSGDLVLAKKMFKDNFKIFTKAGIKKIITTCGGCLYALNNIYPKYVPNWNIEIKHITQIIYDLYKNGKLKFKKLKKEITYHDPCRTGRKLNGMDIYNEPRELLRNTSERISELSKNKEFTPCCGAGSGIRGVDSSISIKIGSGILNDTPTDELITSCPLCVFNYRYVEYKTQINKKIKYITDYLLEASE